MDFCYSIATLTPEKYGDFHSSLGIISNLGTNSSLGQSGRLPASENDEPRRGPKGNVVILTEKELVGAGGGKFITTNGWVFPWQKVDVRYVGLSRVGRLELMDMTDMIHFYGYFYGGLYNSFTLNHESFHPSPPSLGFVSKRTQRNVKVAYPHLAQDEYLRDMMVVSHMLFSLNPTKPPWLFHVSRLIGPHPLGLAPFFMANPICCCLDPLVNKHI